MFQQFVHRTGREPMTPSEWMSIQNSAVNYLNKTKGVPPGPKKSPFQGFTPKVIPGGKGIEDLLKTGDVQKGVAPKTKPRPEGLDVKTQQDVIKENWAAKQKQKNKEAIERFKQKTKKKTVEDFRDEGDFDPGGFAGGGIIKALKNLLKKKKSEPKDFIWGVGGKKIDLAPLRKKHGLDKEALKKAEEAHKLRLQEILAKHSTKHADGGRIDYATGGLAYMLGEPNTRTEALQEFGVVTDPWGMYTDPSLYAKGERGSGVPGRAAYKEGGVGQGPWTMGQGAPTPDQEQNLDTPQPQVMGTPNPLQMPPGIPSAAPQTMQPQYMRQQMQHAMMQQQMMGQQPRMGYAGGGMGRRAFMKLMAGLTALPFIGKGLTKKAAAPAVKEVTETVIEKGADGIPKYAFDLIEVVKAKGTKEIMEGLAKRNPPATKYNYKGVEVVEDGLGNTSVRKEQTKTGSWTDQATDDTIVDDYVDREIGFEIKQGEIVKGKDGKPIKAGDEYNESTAYMQGDPEGGMDVSEVLEVIDDADHLELKKIADEIKDIRPKKASGGLAYMLGE